MAVPLGQGTGGQGTGGSKLGTGNLEQGVLVVFGCGLCFPIDRDDPRRNDRHGTVFAHEMFQAVPPDRWCVTSKELLIRSQEPLIGT